MSNFNEKTQQWLYKYRHAPMSHAVMDLDERLRKIEERMLILDPPLNEISKYPALKSAYEQYKLIEKLSLGGENE